MKDDFFYRTIARVFLDLLIFFGALFAPWWVCLFFVLVGIFYFGNFVEAFLVGLLLDALYGAPSANVYHFRLFFGTLFFILWLVGDFLKRKLRFFDI